MGEADILMAHLNCHINEIYKALNHLLTCNVIVTNSNKCINIFK